MNEPTYPTTAEDTEGHSLRVRFEPARDAEVSDAEEVEGHGYRREPVREADLEAEAAEGHTLRVRFEPARDAEVNDADDTEGHRKRWGRSGPHVDTSDSEGHAFVLPEERPLVGDHPAPSSTDAADDDGDDTDGHTARVRF